METLKNIEYLATNPDPNFKDKGRSYPNILLKATQLFFQYIGPIIPNTAAKIAYRLFATPRGRAEHKVSDAILESARLFEVLYGRQILKAYEWGKGEKTILLVHGWESRGTAMRSFVPALVENGYRVVAFDGPAHGNSDGKRTNLPHFSGAVRAMVRQVGEVEAVISHSFGGVSSVFAFATDEDMPWLNKLVLIGVPNRLDSVLNDAATILKVPKSVNRKFRAIIQSKINLPIDEANMTDIGKKLKLGEALIVHDQNDAIVPFAAAQMTFEAWENAQLVAVDGLGHYRLMKHPAVVKRVVNFIID